MPRMLQPARNLLVLLLSSLALAEANAQQFVIKSPDKKIAARVSIGKDGKAVYSINYLNELVLQDSKLGVIREDADLSAGLQFIAASKQTLVTDHYKIVNAKKSQVNYLANRRVIMLKNNSAQQLNIIFQVSNDGVAFKYEFPETSTDIKKIKEEATSFHFIEGTRAWLQPKTEAQSGWEHTNPSYEAHYKMDIATGTSSPGKNGWVYPALFRYNNTWLLITEAGLGRTYCGTALQQHSPGNEYRINFPQEPEKFTNGVLYPASALPWQTPWRIIAVGSLKTIAESTLGTDLAFPAKTMDTSFIKPGQASWSWILSKDNFIVYGEQKKYIDHAADMHWDYCLVDADWDRKIGYDKIKELADYAATKNVGLLLWYNSAGDWNTVKYTPKDKLLTHESRVKEFILLRKMGAENLSQFYDSRSGTWI
jgi:alpha-glucosidase